MANKSVQETSEEAQETRLPDDLITQHILPSLPIKPLSQLKVISKEWYSYLSSPNFILKYTKQPLFPHPGPPLESLFIQSGNTFYLYSCSEHDDNVVGVEFAGNIENNLVELNVEFDTNIKLVGSSNGLICLAHNKGRYFILYNPTINQSNLYYTPGSFSFQVCWGFGYVPSIDDYKVVGIVQSWSTDYSLYVFSLKTNNWRKIDTGLNNEYFVIKPPRFVNGTLYWSAVHCITAELKIVAFDLALENYCLFPHMRARSPYNSILCVMGGCLAMCVSNDQKDLEINIVKRSGRVVSVHLSCGLSRAEFTDLIGFTKTGKIFVAFRNPAMLCLVDSNSKQPILMFEDRATNEIASYVPSQVSPHPPMEFSSSSA